ncbi:MAG TPA: 5'-nucleotidase [Gammaproteobacteria bacterium]|nr:5'-nucleotidase [Gammaproteobacteria bacterium]
MFSTLSNKLIVAISSRALFNLDEEHEIYEKEGIEAYTDYQRTKEQEPLAPGPAFGLVQKFLKLNEGRENKDALVEVLLISRNSADTGLRVFHSIRYYGLDLTRAAFAGGKSPYGYAKAFGADLFLSLNQDDVEAALQNNLAAATIWSINNETVNDPNALKIAFDGDSVLFSDESERIFQEEGLAAFHAHEDKHAKLPMSPGPFKGFLSALEKLQKKTNLSIPVRTALVTARSAPAHERVIHTLRSWDIRIDESLFLGGLPKVEFLSAFGADIFFDDHVKQCDTASTKITSAHVPFGVRNPSKKM